MFRYEVSRALHEYLKPILDAVGDINWAFCAISTNQVENQGDKLLQSASLIVFYLCCRLHLPSVAWGRPL